MKKILLLRKRYGKIASPMLMHGRVKEEGATRVEKRIREIIKHMCDQSCHTYACRVKDEVGREIIK